jgi:hypothetical protein
MRVIENEQLAMIDCDDTLIMWGSKNKKHPFVTIIDPYDGKKAKVRKHLGHIKVLKDRKVRGAFIVVWSAGGYKWAEAVVKALKLENFVDIIASKPIMYVDDKEAVEILGERLYLGADSKYGT